MADIDYDQLSEKLAAAIVKATTAGTEAKKLAEDQDKLSKATKDAAQKQIEFARTLKELSSRASMVTQLVRGQRRDLIDVREALAELDKEIENDKEALARHGATVDENGRAINQYTLQQKELNRAKQEEAVLEANKKVAIVNATLGLGKFGDTLVNTIGAAGANFVRELQRGGNNVDISTNLLKGGVDVVKTSVGGFAGAMEMAGEIGLLIAKRFRPLYIGLIAFGKALGFVTEKAAELSKFAFDILSEEIKKTSEAYQKSNTAGALFADGMSGLRNAAGAAGLTLVQFSEMIAKHTDDLAEIGEGITGGAIRVGRVLDPLTSSGSRLRSELLNLGYSIEEHGGLVAETMAMMRQSGGRLMASDEEVRQQTTKYAENLRIVAAITGEDAKKKAEAVRQQANQLAFQQKLAQMPEQQRAATLRAMNAMSDLERRNFMDMVNFGTVINKEGAAAQAMSGALQDLTSDHYQKFRDRTLDDTTVLDAQKQYGGALKDQILALVDIGAAGAANLGGFVQALSEAYAKELAFRNRSTQEAIDAARENVGKQRTTQDPLTVTVNDVNKQMQEFKLILEQEILGSSGALTMYAKTLRTMNDEILEQVRKITGKDRESLLQTQDDKNWERMNGWQKIESGLARLVEYLAELIPFIGERLGKEAREARIKKETEYFEKKDRQETPPEPTPLPGKLVNSDVGLGMATGGVIKGPRKLIAGENPQFPYEAFVPLPDGKTIPVTVKMSDAQSPMLVIPKELTALYENLSTIAVTSSKNIITSGLNVQDLNESFIREIGTLSRIVEDSGKMFANNLTESKTYINDVIKTFADLRAIKQFAYQTQQAEKISTLSSPDVIYTAAIKQTMDLNLAEFKSEIKTALDEAKSIKTEKTAGSVPIETAAMDISVMVNQLKISNNDLKETLLVQNRLLEQSVQTVQELVSVASDTRTYSQTIAQNTL